MAEKVIINYTEDNIRSLEWQEHIRIRPGMYIGKLGDGSNSAMEAAPMMAFMYCSKK